MTPNVFRTDKNRRGFYERKAGWWDLFKIDDGDLWILDAYSLEASRDKSGRITRIRAVDRETGKHTGLARIIANPPTGYVVDHINCDPLDNRRQNLRICLPAENSKNRRKANGLKSKFKGVCPRNSGWQASICVNYKNIYLGVYECEIEAARAYDCAALNYFGEFARLNFLEGEGGGWPFKMLARTPYRPTDQLDWRDGILEGLGSSADQQAGLYRSFHVAGVAHD